MPQSLAALGGAAPPATAGQLWVANETGGHMYSDNLSDELRTVVQARCRFRQFADLPENKHNVRNAGEAFHWNIYDDIEDEGGELNEQQPIPTSRFLADQGTCIVTEWGLAVPYSGLLDDLSAHPVREIIKSRLEPNAARAFDRKAHGEFSKTLLKVVPGGIDFTSPDQITLTEDGTAAGNNNAALTAKHVKAISRKMRSRDIPTFRHGDYYSLGSPDTFEVVEDDLENIHQYTQSGLQMIMNGEKGRYAGVRMIEQTNIDTTDFATNGKSSEAFFFGDDAVKECVVIPEEMRGKIPDDYGRGKGVAWYAILNFAISRKQAKDQRIVHWTSAA